ncbi:glycerol-3-phosphate acyltransferase [candidate division WOR-3 bacterium]|nr:glycerol-3-phosphate acyltransferase [candidate division WOR-3 bacterium]
MGSRAAMDHNSTILGFIVAGALGWVCGIIPFSYCIARFKGIDLTKTGSGNIGATNLGRACGLSFFILGFVLDGVKGLAPVLIARSLSLPAMCAGAGAMLGHIYNPLFKGKGGKGVSTVIGVALGLVPRAFTVSIGIWLIVYVTTLIVSIASLSLAITMPIAAFVINDGTFLDRLFLIILGVLIIIAHRANIQRLFQGTEPKTKLWEKK